MQFSNCYLLIRYLYSLISTLIQRQDVYPQFDQYSVALTILDNLHLRHHMDPEKRCEHIICTLCKLQQRDAKG